MASPLVLNDLYTDLGTPCVASAAGPLCGGWVRGWSVLRRLHLPPVEDSDGRTPRNLIPLTITIPGWGMNEDFDLVLWIQDSDARQFANIVRVSLNLQLHNCEF